MSTTTGQFRSAASALKHRLSQEWRKSSLPAFIYWWRQQLIACLPRRWRIAVETLNSEELVYWREGAFQNEQEMEIHEVPSITSAYTRRRVLILPHDHVIRVPVQLPIAARDNLEAALAFEIDRYTPFKEHQVYFSYLAADEKNEGSRYLDLWLIVALRERLDDVLEQAHMAGLTVDAVDARGTQGGRLKINLLAQHRPARRANPTTRLHLILGSVLLASVVCSMMLWVANRQSTLEAMSLHVKNLRKDTQQIQALQQQLNASSNAARFVKDEMARHGSKAALLSELATCIPTDTWLEELSINPQGVVSLSGQSTQAGTLIEHMKSCSSLESVRFQGIIQPDASTGRDRFNLTAQLRIKDDDHGSTPDSP